ncbi:MAG: universal stress protein [Dongiaceae bacterium]
MSIKTILVLADGGPGGDATLATAITVARGFAAHLDVLHVRADPETMVPIVGEGMSGAMVEQVMEAMARAVEARAAAARTAYERLCAPSGLSLAWREVTGREPEIVALSGRVADLTVLSRPSGESEAPLAATLDAALFETGRPALVVPAPALPTVGSRIVLAWDGSVQAARAVGVALPFLRLAQQVTVTTAGEADRRVPAEALLAYLARHEVRAQSETFAAAAGVGKGLIELAARLRADLLVMGAYGHSRLREMILGGATREVLTASPVPVLMAH